MNNLEDLKKWLNDNNAFTEKGLSSGITRKIKNNKELLETFKRVLGIESEDPAELIYNVMNPDCNKVCKICGAPTTFFKYFYGYKDTCSRECQLKFVQQKSEDTKLARYGNKNFTNIEKRLQTIESTRISTIDKTILESNQKRFCELLDNRDIKYTLFRKKDSNYIKVKSFVISEKDLAEDKFYNRIDDLFKVVYKVSLEEFINGIIEGLPKTVPTLNLSIEDITDLWYGLKIPTSKDNSTPAKLLNYFHPSIYKGKVGKNISIEEAWKDKLLLRRAVLNRIIYSKTLEPVDVLKGFYVSKIIPRVSIFSPSLAKYILEKYCTQDIIFDPFSGFSGRMLGACSLNKKYLGQDINKEHVEESNNIINYLGLNAEVTQKDIFESSGDYPCLFTCSPYRLKERWNDTDIDKTCDEWIDECLKRFKCKEYIFVVDETEKYKDYIVEEIVNKSPLSKSKEYIVVIRS